MAYPLVRLVLRGHLDGNQSWSTHCDFTVIGSGTPGQADLNSWLGGVNTAMTTWVGTTGGLTSLLAANDGLDELVAYYYSAPGITPALTAVQARTDVGSGSRAFPTQTCIVHSLLTGRPGRINRGRMYLPCSKQAVDTVHAQLTTATAGILATNLATFITSCNTPPLGADAVGAGPMNSAVFYNSVRVDSRLDIQRRRSDKILIQTSGNHVI